MRPSNLIAVLLLTSMLTPACGSESLTPIRRDGWSSFDFWQPQQDRGGLPGRAWDAGPAQATTDAQPSPPLPPPIEQSPPTPGVTCSGGLSAEGTRWVKKGAGAQSIYTAPKMAGANPAIAGTIPEGGAMKFFPSASQSGWACVLHGGAYGYVDASNLATVPPAGGFGCKPGLKQNGYRWVKAGTGALNLRSQPTSDGGTTTVIAVILEGASNKAAYYPDGDEPGWACLGYAGKTGYAAAKYLATTPPVTSGGGGDPPGAGDDPGTGVCAKNPAAFWCGPFTKPCDWRTTKGDCESVHWFTGIFDQNATPCCIWVIP